VCPYDLEVCLFLTTFVKSYLIIFAQLIGLPPRYRDSVRAITPGLPLFLYNYTTHQLHGIFEVYSLTFTPLICNGFLQDA
jgi:hypothetical protein